MQICILNGYIPTYRSCRCNYMTKFTKSRIAEASCRGKTHLLRRHRARLIEPRLAEASYRAKLIEPRLSEAPPRQDSLSQDSTGRDSLRYDSSNEILLTLFLFILKIVSQTHPISRYMEVYCVSNSTITIHVPDFSKVSTKNEGNLGCALK